MRRALSIALVLAIACGAALAAGPADLIDAVQTGNTTRRDQAHRPEGECEWHVLGRHDRPALGRP